MTAYLLNILLLILFGTIFLWHKPSQTGRKIFCILSTIQWLVLSGLRHYSVGTDTLAYLYKFERTSNESWSDLWNMFIQVMFKGYEGPDSKDPGYPIFEKIVQIFTMNYQVYLIILALIFTIPLGVWIYKNSKDPFISFLIYSTLFYSFFAITGFRQTIATALVVLIGHKFIKEKKFIPFFILTIIAFTIHKSSVVFFPFYFIAHNKITNRYLGVFMGISAAVLVFGKTLYAPIIEFFGYDQFLDGLVGSVGRYAFLVLAIMFIGIWRIPSDKPEIKHMYNAMLIGTLGTMMAYQNQSFMRFQQYFTLYLMLFVPEIIHSFKNKERVLVYFISVCVLILMFIRTNPQYKFFW